MSNEPQLPDNKTGSILFYPLIIISGFAGAVLTTINNLQAIYSALGLSTSIILIGIGFIGLFVTLRKFSFLNGILFSLIWTLLILLAGLGYFVILTRPVSLTGSLLNNNVEREPISGYIVRLYHYATGSEFQVRTDYQGNFRFNELSAGEYDIIINDSVISSGSIESGWRKLLQSDVDEGRFYLDSLGRPVVQYATSPTPNDTVTQIVPLIVAATPTRRPTNTPRPPANTPTLSPTSTNIPQELILYEEDFEDGIPNNFKFISGNWTIIQEEDNKVYQAMANEWWAFNSLGEPIWSDYTLEVQFKWVDIGTGDPDGRVDIGFRTQQEGIINNYVVFIDPSGSVGMYRRFLDDEGRWFNTEDESMFHVLTSAPTLNEWNNLNINVKNVGDTAVINVHLNGQNFTQVFDNDSPYLQGSITLGVIANTKVYFDNIRVWGG